MFRTLKALAASGICAACFVAFGGCEKKENVIDIQTPLGDVKVDKVTDPTGKESVDIDVNVGKEKEAE